MVLSTAGRFDVDPEATGRGGDTSGGDEEFERCSPRRPRESKLPRRGVSQGVLAESTLTHFPRVAQAPEDLKLTACCSLAIA